jgi:hypothetical protein
METRAHILVRANTTSEKLMKLLQGLEGVKSVMSDADEEGVVQLESEADQDVRPLIARTLIEAQLDLLEIRPLDISLEDIYIRLMKSEREDS